jgi:hypothetical protein
MGCEVVANDTDHVLYAARECNKLHGGRTMRWKFFGPLGLWKFFILRSSSSFCPSTNPSAALICHHCEKYKQTKQRRSRSSFPFRAQSQTPPNLYKLPQYTPTIIPGLYQDPQPVLWLVIWNVAGAEVWRQTPERQGGDVNSSVRTSRRFEYSVVVASIQRKDESRMDYERMFRPPLRPTLFDRRCPDIAAFWHRLTQNYNGSHYNDTYFHSLNTPIAPKLRTKGQWPKTTNNPPPPQSSAWGAKVCYQYLRALN